MYNSGAAPSDTAHCHASWAGFVLAVLLAVILFAGCGTDATGSSSTSTPTPTKPLPPHYVKTGGIAAHLNIKHTLMSNWQILVTVFDPNQQISSQTCYAGESSIIVEGEKLPGGIKLVKIEGCSPDRFNQSSYITFNGGPEPGMVITSLTIQLNTSRVIDINVSDNGYSIAPSS